MQAITAYNEWSCGLAVLESIARPQGIDFEQAAFIERYRDRFPAWQQMPGVLALNISWVGPLWLVRWELYDIARELGLADHLKMLRDPQALEAHLALPSAAVVAVTQRFRENGAWVAKNHAVRILGYNAAGVELMNPGRHSPGRVETIAWDEFMAWEPFVFALSKDGSTPSETLVEPQDFKA